MRRNEANGSETHRIIYKQPHPMPPHAPDHVVKQLFEELKGLPDRVPEAKQERGQHEAAQRIERELRST